MKIEKAPLAFRLIAILSVTAFGAWTLNACLEEAYGKNRTRIRGDRSQIGTVADTPADSGVVDSGVDGGVAGIATYEQTWDVAFDGRTCAATPNFNPWVAALGTFSQPLDGTDQNYSCANSSAGLAEDYFGTALANTGVDMTSACWVDATSDWLGLANDVDLLVRVITNLEAGIGATQKIVAQRTSSSELWQIEMNASEQVVTSFREGGLTTCAVTHSVNQAAGLKLIDVFYDANNPGNSNLPTITVCVNGTCESTNCVSNFADFASAGPFSIAGNTSCTENITTTDIFFLGWDRNPAWFSGEATHDAHCTGLTICP